MNKPGLVLIPGLLLTADLWRYQVADLADLAEISVADHTRHERISEIAAAILAAAPPRFALAGLSFGGYIALEIMRQEPDRVDRLALLDTSARPDRPDQVRSRTDFIALTEKGRFLGVTEGLVKTFVHPDRHGDDELMALIKKMAQDIGKKAFIRQERAILSRPDSRPDLPRIHCPTLVLCGRQDALTPVELHEEMAAAIPSARLVVIENCGHLPPLEKPDEVSEAMQAWLAA